MPLSGVVVLEAPPDHFLVVLVLILVLEPLVSVLVLQNGLVYFSLPGVKPKSGYKSVRWMHRAVVWL